MRLDNLGWVWAPSKNGVFKPGEVYWLRGKNFLGWGPLAPGEQWDPADPVNPLPQQFLNVNTTYAAPPRSFALIDPAGFTQRPKELQDTEFMPSTGSGKMTPIRRPADPLKGVEFLAALPSPPFLAAKLDAVRPLVNAASLRVKPVVDGVTIETASHTAAPRPQPAAPAPAPIVVVTQPAPQATPDPEVVEVPVPVPAGIVFVTTDRGNHPSVHGAAPAPPAFPAVASGRHEKGGRAPAPVKKFRSPAESAMATAIVQELDARAFSKAAADLDLWTQRFRDTDFADERAYYYMLAFNGMNQPVKVMDSGAPLVGKPASAAFEDPIQALSVVYLAAVNYQKLGRPAREQSLTARAAAQQLLAMLPVCFTPDHKPQVMSAADWAKSRNDLEALARETLARSAH
jgi:hypothetical protein